MVSFKDITVGILKFHLPPSCGRNVWYFIGFVVFQLLLGLGQIIMGIIDKDSLSIWIGLFWFLICIILCCLTAIPGVGYVFGWLLIIPYIYFIILLVVACIFFFSGNHPFEKTSYSSGYTSNSNYGANYNAQNTTVESVHIDT